MILLERTAFKSHGTFGVLRVRDCEFHTVERPWLDNVPFVSCIPAREYTLGLRFFRRRGYWTYEVENVPKRDAILIHIANSPHEVQGCIGIGMDALDGSVGRSALAMQEFTRAMEGAYRDKILIREIRQPEQEPQ